MLVTVVGCRQQQQLWGSTLRRAVVQRLHGVAAWYSKGHKVGEVQREDAVFLGARFEQDTRQYLEGHFDNLAFSDAVGGPGDEGIDLRGLWKRAKDVDSADKSDRPLRPGSESPSSVVESRRNKSGCRTGDYFYVYVQCKRTNKTVSMAFMSQFIDAIRRASTTPDDASSSSKEQRINKFGIFVATSKLSASAIKIMLEPSAPALLFLQLQYEEGFQGKLTLQAGFSNAAYRQMVPYNVLPSFKKDKPAFALMKTPL